MIVRITFAYDIAWLSTMACCRCMCVSVHSFCVSVSVLRSLSSQQHTVPGAEDGTQSGASRASRPSRRPGVRFSHHLAANDRVSRGRLGFSRPAAPELRWRHARAA